MKKTICFFATILLVGIAFSLDAKDSERIVSGIVTHDSEGVQSEIVFTSGQTSHSVSTDWDGTYMTSVLSNKPYSCTASNEFGSQTQSLSSGSEAAVLDFEF